MRRGFTFIELLCTLAVLVIVLGVVVSLARAVRNDSRQTLTRLMLRDMALALEAYTATHGPPAPRPPLLPPADGLPDAQVLRPRAEANNRAAVAMLLPFLDEVGRALPGGGRPLLSDLPDRFYNGRRLLDAWGMPLVLARPGRELGLGAATGSFFFSAGADTDYLSRGDNLYSYEVAP